jgi:hypothetical protein
MKLFKYLPVMALAFCLAACQNDEQPDPALGTVSLQINHLLNNSPLQLNTARYTNAVGEEYLVENFQFYLSNVKLKNSLTGQVFVEPESYHLVRKNEDTHTFPLAIRNVPAGNYDLLEFSIGVDEERNFSLDQVGDLDPSNNMAWDWNTGYKFLLLEGRFFPAGQEPRGLVYHVGGMPNYRTLTFDLGNQGIFVEKDQTATLQLDTEISEIFKNPNPINFQEANVVMFGPFAEKVADNYSTGMFTLRLPNQ